MIRAYRVTVVDRSTGRVVFDGDIEAETVTDAISHTLAIEPVRWPSLDSWEQGAVEIRARVTAP